MRARDILRGIGGAAAIYVVMAACSASEQRGGTLLPSDASAPAILDAMTKPVREAQAGPLAPDIATEACDKADPTNVYRYAEHAYPGRLKTDLARLSAIGHLAATSSALVGYVDLQLGAFLKDGSALVLCGPAKTPATYDSVTFVLPQ